jgi:quinoprotein dehydrogenase-associated probable ABC transporter substrate-binding protein
MRKIGMERRHFVRMGLMSAALFGALALWQGYVAKAQTGGDENGAIELVDPKVLRVCADPHHLPFSDKEGAGFENKIAALLAKKLGKKLAYTYYPDTQGFIRNTLNTFRCDVVMGIAQGVDVVQTTNPYYRTSYVLVTKKDSDLATVQSFTDPKLKDKRLGVVAGSAPASYLVADGLIDKSKSYPLFIDTRYSSPAKNMLNDLRDGKIDAAILWGPLGGYLAKESSVPLHVQPLVKDTGGPQEVYRICMGVRHSDQNWKRTLNKLIAANSTEINDILRSYGVPLLDEHDAPIAH